ncbi:hypothetical protein SADUNF_Sadunf10G0096900 [Salix dunnii]|uniref:Uncharacterized protein n=1 Tax=Salix dunnii TaxID=1413687 RepID=A0A835JQL2_9ROSI|nr:hypothetical protein SADUNF_Sadunf10G0096900 [Salix dunnii]
MGFDFYSIIVKSFLDEDILVILIEFTDELDLFSYDSNLLCADMLRSSIAAARADNFYYPPEWSPKKKFNSVIYILIYVDDILITGWVELISWATYFERESKKAGPRYFDIIRFEVPFNMWCGGCTSLIASGKLLFHKVAADMLFLHALDFSPRRTCHLLAPSKFIPWWCLREASLLIHFTVFENQEEDLQKKKEAEPVQFAFSEYRMPGI